MTLHGDTRIDNYYWLRDDERARPDVLEYLHAENAYGKRVMDSQLSLQETSAERNYRPHSATGSLCPLQ